jgi:hypothetical protein
MIEVLKQTVNALELVSTEFVCDGAHHAKKDRHELGEPCPIIERYEEAIQAGKQAIAKLESQEPVATVTSETGNPDVMMSWWHEPALAVGTKLFTYAPQRTWERPWVSLTDEEIDFAIGFVGSLGSRQDARSIEAKLKEKNT